MKITSKSITVHSESELSNLTLTKTEDGKLIITLKNTVNGQVVLFSEDWKEFESLLGNFLYE